jgi:hypothetical protein
LGKEKKEKRKNNFLQQIGQEECIPELYTSLCFNDVFLMKTCHFAASKNILVHPGVAHEQERRQCCQPTQRSQPHKEFVIHKCCSLEKPRNVV